MARPYKKNLIMKKKMQQLTGTCLMVLASFTAFSQTNDNSTPKWVSDNGYWVVESNIHHPKQHTIWFYNNNHVLVGAREIASARLNIKKKKVKMQLKSMLESSLDVWARQHPGSQDQQLAKKNDQKKDD